MDTLPAFMHQLSPMCYCSILMLILTSILCGKFYIVIIDFKLADIKLESSEAYLLNLEKNLF